jgi:phage tail-like protein
MAVPRPFALLSTADQWRRAAFQNTALEQNVVQLAWVDTTSAGSGGGIVPVGAALAFDCECRLYHSVPEQNGVERVLWAAEDPLRPSAIPPQPVDLFAPPSAPQVGEFHEPASAGAALADPRGVCVDDDDRLFIAEHGSSRILVFDLESRKLLRAVPLAGRPGCMVAHQRVVYAALDSPTGLVRLDARRGPWPVEIPPQFVSPARLAFAPDGALWVLAAAGSAAATVFPLDQTSLSFVVPFATDLVFLNDPAGPILVLARMPGDDFLRFRISPNAREEMPPLTATAYDGRGVVCTPDKRIAYWTANGLRYAVAARLKYLDTGQVTTFRLDSGDFFTTWGRIFLDACIPAGTDLRIHCVALDEPPDDGALPRTPPANLGSIVITRPDLSPPMIPLSLVPDTVDDRVYRRDTGPETPWVRFPAGDLFRTYEAPILSGPGRYLWVTVELRGNTRSTPRLRAIRAEHPAHDYLRRLPKTYSRDEQKADFLIRYLAMVEGELGDWEARSVLRRALIEATSAPDEILPWLAGFLGLVLDERWSVAVRRKLIAEATLLFRFRGTVAGLLRFLEITLDPSSVTQPFLSQTGNGVVIIENYRLRGIGGALLGEQGPSGSVLGTFRIGGALGDPTANLAAAATDDAFDSHAHRFIVLIQQSLSQEQSDMIQHLLDVHRPAHTLVQVCTVGAGMRVGRGLLIGLTSIIGRTDGFMRFQLGSSVLGRGAVLGRALAGTFPGASVIGRDTHVG